MRIRFDHIMMHTTDMQKSIDFLREVVGMELENTDEYIDFRLAYMINKETNIKFELREVYGQEKQENGAVIGHFAFYVDDVAQIILRFEKYCKQNMINLANKFEEHVSEKHSKMYHIFTCFSPDGIEISFLQKVRG